MNQNALDRSMKYLDSWLSFRYNRCDIPGYVVAVAHKGETIFNQAYGYANTQNQSRLSTNHKFRIASHSKTFTATAVMQLAEQNKLQLDDKVVVYLDWLNAHKDQRWKMVTIRQLLSHGAGIIRDGLDDDYWQLERPFPNENELKEMVLDSELVIDFNVKLKYSNVGYSILGMLIETVSGQTYNDYVSQHIVEPLNLANTGPEYCDAIESELVTGYSRADLNRERMAIPQVDTKAMSAATGFYSTADDLCSYFSAHFIGSGLLLSDESKVEMQSTQWKAKSRKKSQKQEYGLGISIDYVNSRRTFGHSGGFPGQITKSMADPDDGLVVVVLTNCIDSPASDIASGIYSVIDHFQKYSSDSGEDIGCRFEGRFMELWSIYDLVATGGRIVSIDPDSWEPFAEWEELEIVDDSTLKIVDASSFESPDELVHFTFDSGNVKNIRYAGSTMWPEDNWDEILRSGPKFSAKVG